MKGMLLMLKMLNAPEYALLKGCFFSFFFPSPSNSHVFLIAILVSYL